MMNIDSWIDQQGRYLQSRPVPVRMAGFESSTLKMQMNGWQISVESRRDMLWDGYDIQCAFRHDGIKQVAMGRMRISRESIGGGRFDPYAFGIDINYIAPMIRLLEMPMPRMWGEFQAIDARPNFAQARDLSEFAMFKSIKADPDFEIYIHEKDEQEILDILLKKQDPRQKEIRQNQKRRAYHEGNESKMMVNDNAMKDDINTDIKHQIILVA